MNKEYKLIEIDGQKLYVCEELYNKIQKCDEQNKEIERLNNIINELENFIETYAIPEFNISEEPTRYFMETKIILDKLKELKENK